MKEEIVEVLRNAVEIICIISTICLGLSLLFHDGEMEILCIISILGFFISSILVLIIIKIDRSNEKERNNNEK